MTYMVTVHYVLSNQLPFYICFFSHYKHASTCSLKDDIRKSIDYFYYIARIMN